MRNKFLKKEKLNKHGPLVLQIPTKIDYFLEKINEKQHFSLVRRQSEWYWVVREGLRRWLKDHDFLGHKDIKMPPFLLMPGGGGLGPGPEAFCPRLLSLLEQNFVRDRSHATQYFYDTLANHNIAAWDENLNRGRNWTFQKRIASDIIKMVVEPKPANFIFSCHSAAVMHHHHSFPKGKPKIYEEPNKAWHSHLISAFIPPGEEPFMSTIWREWARTGEIDRIFQDIGHKEDYKIVVVGPPYFKNFDKRADLRYFEHIEISHTNAAAHVEEYLELILQRHESFLKHHDNVFYLLVGGDAAVWLTYQLHGKLDNAFMIEAGRAIDVYYFYCRETLAKYPQWQFGEWMMKNPPTWYNEQKRIRKVHL